jgi:hypothetical protein
VLLVFNLIAVTSYPGSERRRPGTAQSLGPELAGDRAAWFPAPVARSLAGTPLVRARPLSSGWVDMNGVERAFTAHYSGTPASGTFRHGEAANNPKSRDRED